MELFTRLQNIGELESSIWPACEQRHQHPDDSDQGGLVHVLRQGVGVVSINPLVQYFQKKVPVSESHARHE